MRLIRWLIQLSMKQIAWFVVHTVNWDYVEREARRMAEKEKGNEKAH